jgi:hypothetical protein
MPLPIIGSILSIGEKLIDKLIPDPEQKANALLKLKELEQSGIAHRLAARHLRRDRQRCTGGDKRAEHGDLLVKGGGQEGKVVGDPHSSSPHILTVLL